MDKKSDEKTEMHNHENDDNEAQSVEHEQELEGLKKEIQDLKDQCLRAYAETENIRKRSDREIQEARKYSISGVVEDLVNVVESLYRSTEHIDAEDKKNEKIKKIAEGIELTRKELMGVLIKHHVKRIEPKLGDVFDHNFHEALSQAPDAKHPKNAIINVIQAGYMIEDRLIKPALVIISSGK